MFPDTCKCCNQELRDGRYYLVKMIAVGITSKSLEYFEEMIKKYHLTPDEQMFVRERW